jgi:hypothetical protein
MSDPKTEVDPECLVAELRGRPRLAVPRWLILGYLYEQGTPAVSDKTWDWLCEFLDEHWDSIEHPHKRWVPRGALKDHSIVGVDWCRVPHIVKGAAVRLRNSLCERKR